MSKINRRIIDSVVVGVDVGVSRTKFGTVGEFDGWIGDAFTIGNGIENVIFVPSFP